MTISAITSGAMQWKKQQLGHDDADSHCQFVTITVQTGKPCIDVRWTNVETDIDIRLLCLQSTFIAETPVCADYHRLLQRWRQAQLITRRWKLRIIQHDNSVTLRCCQLPHCDAARTITPLSSLNTVHRDSKTGRHYTLVHIFAKYWPIFIILSPTHSVGNLQ